MEHEQTGDNRWLRTAKAAEPDKRADRQRYSTLDTIRGITLVSMLLYHGTWDLVYLCGKAWSWYEGVGAYIWQQSICWSFILLSGFCWRLGKRPVRRGLWTLGAGALVTVVTLLFLYENRVIFGVLTFLGSAMLVMIPLDAALRKLSDKCSEAWRHAGKTIRSERSIAAVGLLLSLGLFCLTRNVNHGTLGMEDWELWQISELLYQNPGTAFLGFPPDGFFLTDYFSFFPWFFLFVAGYFLQGLLRTPNEAASAWYRRLWTIDMRSFSFLGRHSLLIYLIHQPVLYLACMVFG